MQAFLKPPIPAPLHMHRPVRGFTLIELMTVLTIVAILLAIGTPMLAEFVADQRVRTATSDIVVDIAFARAKAVERSRRIIIKRTGATWKNGWTIYDNVNNNLTVDAGEELKVFDGFSPGNMVVCTVGLDFVDTIIFRPDGRIVHVLAPPAASDGIYVVDTLKDSVQSNNKIRGILFGLSGRAAVFKFNGEVPAC